MSGGEHRGTAASRGWRWFGAALGFAPLGATLIFSGSPMWIAGDGILGVLAVTLIVAAPPVAILLGCLVWLRRRALLPRGRNVLVLCQGAWAGLSAWIAFSINDFASGWYQGNAVGLLSGCAAALVLWAAWAAEDRTSP